MRNVAVAIQILPLGASEEKVLEIVDGVIQFIQKRTDQYEVSAFETTIEGEYEEVMALVTDVIRYAGQQNSQIFTNLKVNYKNKGQVLTADEKVEKYRQ